MHRIIYLSWAAAPLAQHQLEALLQVARRRNAQLNVTGIMLYGNERFIQVLEGEEAVVRELYERVKRDTRHHHVIAYADRPVAERVFAGWSMAFQTATPKQFDELAGYLGAPANAEVAAGLPPDEQHLLDILRSFTLP